jgi:hypothetical protein
MVLRRAAEHRLHGEPLSGQGLAAASTTMARLAPRIGVRPGRVAQHPRRMPRTAASNPMNRVVVMVNSPSVCEGLIRVY